MPPPLQKAHSPSGPLRLTQASEGRFHPNRAGQWTPQELGQGPQPQAPGISQVSPWSVSRPTLAKDSEALDPSVCLRFRKVQRGRQTQAGSGLTPKRATG